MAADVQRLAARFGQHLVQGPTLPEVASTTTAYSTVADWKRRYPLGYVGASCSYQAKTYLVGNPDLKAEKVDNSSLGVMLQPLKKMSLSLDCARPPAA